MIGDIFTIEPAYYQTAKDIWELLQVQMPDYQTQKYCISIAGESGSGKTITAVCLANLLHEKGIKTEILHQDDYFFFPPNTNHQKRIADLSWVGTQEVNLALLQSHVNDFLAAKDLINKPLVNYHENLILPETRYLTDIQVLIIEGTYVSLLTEMAAKIFIKRDYKDTLQQRIERGRDVISEFTNQVLEIEHQIISAQSKNADIFVQKDYQVTKNTKG